MHIYMSGTPRNDPYQVVENRLCTHRLFSMHGAYEKAVLRWLADVRNGVFTADDYFRAYPQARDNAINRDAKRRIRQAKFKDMTDPTGRWDAPFASRIASADWDTAEVIQNVCHSTQMDRPYPKFILLDSGAFTAWNMGEETRVDDVLRKYARFIERADDLFDEIWMINLDVIPGERGRDPTQAELDQAVVDSDKNFEILVREFGNHVLPVFHQGEAWERLDECMDQVDGKSNYICVSPRNDLPEGARVAWSFDAHKRIEEVRPHIITHGLATTGNEMIRTVPWYSGDSAAWVQHGGFGMVDIFRETPRGFPRPPHYMNFFLTLDNTEKDEDASIDDGLSTLRDGKILDEGKHYCACAPEQRRAIEQRISRMGFPFEVACWDSRVRNLICMAEFTAFGEWDERQKKQPGTGNLLRGLV